MESVGTAIAVIGSVVGILGLTTAGIYRTLGSHKKDICKLDDEKVGHPECNALHRGMNQRLDDPKDAVQTTEKDSKDDRVRL